MNARAFLLLAAPLFCAAGVLSSPPSLAQGRALGQLQVREIRAAVDSKAYMPFLKETLTSELYFVKKVCDPAAAQFDEIHREGLEAIEKLGVTYGNLKRRRAKSDTWPDPNETITVALQHAVDRLLPADIAKTYQAEVAARMDARKAANAAAMVAVIDRQVLLDSDQQSEVFENVRANWKSDWSTVNVVVRYPQYAVLPEPDLLRPHLSELQQRLWSYRPRRRNATLSWQTNFGVNNFTGVTGLELLAQPDATGDDEESK